MRGRIINERFTPDAEPEYRWYLQAFLAVLPWIIAAWMLMCLPGCYGPHPPEEAIKACIEKGGHPEWRGAALGTSFTCMN